MLGSCNAFMADGDFCTAASVDPNWVVKQARNPGKTFDTHYYPRLFWKLNYVQYLFMTLGNSAYLFVDFSFEETEEVELLVAGR